MRSGVGPTALEETVSDLLLQLGCRAPGAAGICRTELSERAEAIAEPFPIFYQRSLLSWGARRLQAADATPPQGGLGNRRPVSLTSVPGKVRERLECSRAVLHENTGELGPASMASRKAGPA